MKTEKKKIKTDQFKTDQTIDQTTVDAANLVSWYKTVRRDLPWRKDRDPYRIWISEVMLQQTTVVAVIPYYEKFLKRFATLGELAGAQIEDVTAHWAGLGYYSRARNLHKAAQLLQALGGFPTRYEELIQLPGFGPYTARAVASLAFGQSVGVLDGNVIRVLSRRFAIHSDWWRPQARQNLQEIADLLAQTQDSSDLNQGLMELGATICTPHRPACLLCPWSNVCVARTQDKIAELPQKRLRREREIWIWKAKVIEEKGKVALIENKYAPFLKGHWICPGQASRVTAPPKKYDYRHSVTHHDIFVVLAKAKKTDLGKQMNIQWIATKELKKHVPTTLVRKAIETVSRSSLSIITAFALLGLAGGCSNAPKAYSPAPSAKRAEPITVTPGTSTTGSGDRAVSLVAEPLTQIGDNIRPIFSPDGKRVLFISQNRETHPHAQVYEIDLVARTERRITFHDGNDLNAVYFPDGQRILYSSATDEIKEDPHFIRNLQKKYQSESDAAAQANQAKKAQASGDSSDKSASPEIASSQQNSDVRNADSLERRDSGLFELYHSRLDGSDIRRLTKSPGLDGYAALRPDGRFIAFSSERGGKRDLYIMSAAGTDARRIKSDPAREFDPKFSPDGRLLAWSQIGDDAGMAQIFLGDGRALSATPLTNKAAIQINPAWHPNGQEVVFTSNRADNKTFDIYLVDRKGVCLKRLTESTDDELFPAFSPDGRKLAFSSNHSGRWQIYIMNLSLPTACMSETP